MDIIIFHMNTTVIDNTSQGEKLNGVYPNPLLSPQLPIHLLHTYWDI